MDVIQLLALSLCSWAVAARPTWSNKPFIIVSSPGIREGETVKVSCGVPIDYTGGDCRLFRDQMASPFKLQRATASYICEFLIGSEELLGGKPAGRRVELKCDYKIQAYTSEFSDDKSVIIWRSLRKPSLSVRRHFVPVDESVEVICLPPSSFYTNCHFYRNVDHVAQGSCRQNLSGSLLSIFRKPTLLLPVQLTCDYRPDERHFVRSHASDQELLFVVDARRVSSSVSCKVAVEDGQLAALTNSSWTFVRADRPTVTIQATNTSVSFNETCQHAETQMSVKQINTFY